MVLTDHVEINIANNAELCTNAQYVFTLIYYLFRKCCENQIKRASPTQHRIWVILPYKSNAYHAYHA